MSTCHTKTVCIVPTSWAFFPSNDGVTSPHIVQSHPKTASLVPVEDNTSQHVDALVTQEASPLAKDYAMTMAARDCFQAQWLRYVIVQIILALFLLMFYMLFNLSSQGVLGCIVLVQGGFFVKVISDIYEQYKSTRAQRHLALLEHATMDVQDDALIPQMTFTQTVRARMGFVWRENKARIAIAGVLLPSFGMVMVLLMGGPGWVAMAMAALLLIVFIVVIATMTSWEVVFPRKETRQQLDAEILLARKKMAYDDLQGALSSPNMDAQKRGALSEADQKEGGLTPVE